MPQQFGSPIEAALVLIQQNAERLKGPVGSTYAQHHAAEMECWTQWERAGKTTDGARFWSNAAFEIADIYHGIGRSQREEEKKAA